jgi:hypothetical protein
MTWFEIKVSIKNDLMSRGLKNPRIRLNALENIEKILKNYFPEYLKNPDEKFKIIGKDKLKKEIARFKSNQKLNSAESSIINEIYYRISK